MDTIGETKFARCDLHTVRSTFIFQLDCWLLGLVGAVAVDVIYNSVFIYNYADMNYNDTGSQ